ncbi:MAG: 2-polyprenylphenol 6-hydroxylase [Alphaproteobacteria bacterium]|nr:MAG: 2-polyprenylphenol 6-hydroxylase [Alphaproteobacteria bacterium]
MLRTVRIVFRLIVIARTLAHHDALAVLEDVRLPPWLAAVLRLLPRRRVDGRPGQKLARALADLGPSFIKLGQFLSTRADLLGEEIAADLSDLQDRLAPFPAAQARATIEAELGQPVEELFDSFEDTPVSAASIAQVHLATVLDSAPLAADGDPGDVSPEAGLDADSGREAQTGGEVRPIRREVAVKVLRPGIERAFRRDLELLYWLAEVIERTQPALRRLRPVASVRQFADIINIEMDLALEGAAAQELADNFAGDPTYRVPAIDWQRTSRRVLTMGRVGGIPIDDRDALLAAGFDLEEILTKAATIFFNQVFRDGFFHGDQHPGNMFVAEDGAIVAVDFGIMGRLDRDTRAFLADMLLALLARDYRRLAEVHIEAGYLPPGRPPEVFAQALRAVSEPIFDRPLADISFARLLARLLRLSESFDMPVQPQLLLLQKNMMMAEGISRSLDPTLNIWTLAEPLIAEWMRAHRGPEARVRQAAETTAGMLERLPRLLAHAETALAALARDGGRPGAAFSADAGRAAGGGPLLIWHVRALWAAFAGLALVLIWLAL